MSIRIACEDDLSTILTLVKRMHVESPRLARLTFNQERTEQFLRAMLSREDQRCATFVTQEDGESITGFVSGFADTHALSTDVVSAITMFYVLPAYRGSADEERLVCVMKSWASQRGAKWIETGPWVDVAPKHIGEIFGRFGYRPLRAGMEAYPPVEEQALEAKSVWLEQESREVLH